MGYIDADKLQKKIDEIRQDWTGDSTGLEVGELGAELGAAESILDSIDEIITSLQQEEDKNSKEAAIRFRDTIFKRIEDKRTLPSFKGQLLHDFKNEVNTINQIILGCWSDIQYEIYEKIALVFATWGGYHFHPKEVLPEASLQQEGKSEDFEEHWREFEDWADSYNTADYPTAYTRKDIARYFYELGVNARKNE